jgi:DNA-binding ferritin-like protein
VWQVVAPHFSLSIDASQRDRIAQTARRNAKAPVGTVADFASDAAVKQQAASSELRQAIDSLARPQLERLTKLHADTIQR